MNLPQFNGDFKSATMSLKEYPYKTHTKEFRLEAIRLMEESGHTPSEIAMQLGIRRNQFYKWKEQVVNRGAAAFSGKRGRPAKEVQSELATLKQENLGLKEENEVLKKAAAYFARNSSEVRIYSITESTPQDHTYV